MTRILLTGFTPFDGREINGSWVAAQQFSQAKKIEIPVVWGEPMLALRDAIEQDSPDIIISMGEGKEGFFTIETRAQNTRKHRIDNNNQYPNGDILKDGPSVVFASINAQEIRDQLVHQDIPIRVSHDAGQFLCEETLYSLEILKQETPELETVIFVHLPPFGTSLEYRGINRSVDESLLQDFVEKIVAAVQHQHSKSSLQRENNG